MSTIELGLRTGGSRSWPPDGVALAARPQPERADDGQTRLDRWVAGQLRALPMAGLGLRQRRLLAGIAAAEERLRVARIPDARLAEATRAAALRAFFDFDLAPALALVREAARRTIGLRAHPSQLAAAAHLLRGRLVELDTGEGKTLVAGLAAAVAASAGVPTHVVTVNDYLARRDAALMQPLFSRLGIGAGVIHGELAQAARAAQYRFPIVYCTNKDLVFDYLRDRVSSSGIQSQAQFAVRRLHGAGDELRLRGLHFAIVDEADSVLIDEARTPLILSAANDPGRDEAAYAGLLAAARTLEQGRDFELVGPQRIPELLAPGRDAIDAIAVGQGDEVWRIAWVREHYLLQALRALHLLERDHHYVVAEGKVVIVDEFTGRMLPDRSWEQGLHQLVEVKEGCAITGGNRTLARLTYQHFFARYLRLAGMSGTLREVGRETARVYGARTVRVEPNRPCRRIELPPRLLADAADKARAVVAEVRRCREAGQPVLVGTRSVRASQTIAAALAADGIPHHVLNALQNADEAALVAAAGALGAVTVATNMAGRGTDIPLGEGVAARGGLHVVLTEWHESARIDRQLYGRCARQGDPGSCRAIVALDDELIVRHGGTLARRAARQLGSRLAIRILQRRVQAAAEAANAAQRRRTMADDRRMREQLAFSGRSE